LLFWIYACVEQYIDFSEFMECLSRLEAKGFWLRPTVREKEIRTVKAELMRLGEKKRRQSLRYDSDSSMILERTSVNQHLLKGRFGILLVDGRQRTG